MTPREPPTCTGSPARSQRAPGADRPPLFSFVREAKGSHFLGNWKLSCRPRDAHNRIKEGSKQTNGPLSSQPPEDSPRQQNNEVKTASTFIFTCESHLSEVSLFGQKCPVLQMSKKKRFIPAGNTFNPFCFFLQFHSP